MGAPILVVSGPSGAGKTTVGRLIAASFDQSAHIQIDDFMRFIAQGWVDPRLSEAASQNEVLGVSVAASAIQFALGGYTVVVDGHLFPEGAEGMAQMSRRRGIALHYAVLRSDLQTCAGRASLRGLGEGRFPTDAASFRALHARFNRLGVYEVNSFGASFSPYEVAKAVLKAFHCGRLEIRS